MLKLLVIVTLLSSSLCLNPGLYGFVSKKTIGAFKDSAWPKVQQLLSNIQINGQQDIDVKVGHLDLSNLHVQINLDSNNVGVDLDQNNNMIIAGAINMSFSGGGHWKLNTFQYSPDGDMTFTGGIGRIQANVNIDNQQWRDGFVPKIGFNSITLDNVNNLNIQVTNSGLAPVMNLLTDLQINMIQSQIQDQLSNNGGLQNTLTQLLNQCILDNYPVAVPISQYGVAVSTYTTGPIRVFGTGLEVPVEGFTYAINSGYKKNPFCGDMQNYLDPNAIQSDFYAALGDCTLQSAADAQTEAGFKYNLKQSSPLGDINAIVQLNRWDGQNFVFHQDNLVATVFIVITGMVGTSNFTASANAVANVRITRKSASKMQMVPKLTDGILASFDVVSKIARLDNFKVDGIPDILANLLKNALMAENFTEQLDIPQFCLGGQICFTRFNANIREGFIGADADIEFRSFLEETS